MKLVGYVHVCGRQLPVKEGTEEDCHHLENCWGVFVQDEGAIWLDERAPEHMKPFWLMHEALHALIHLSGALFLTTSALRIRDNDEVKEWEEALVRELTPHLLETFGPPRMDNDARPATPGTRRNNRPARSR